MVQKDTIQKDTIQKDTVQIFKRIVSQQNGISTELYLGIFALLDYTILPVLIKD